MLTVLNNLREFVSGKNTMRLTRLWDIARTDGVTLRFTEHNAQITFNGNIYNPAGSFNSSAMQKPAGLKDSNFQTVGVIDSDYITEDDLHLGKYSNARVTQYVVDWLYPWDAITTDKFLIQEVNFTGEKWDGSISGLTALLTRDHGEIVTRLCRYKFGDARCTFDVSSITQTSPGPTSVDATNPNTIFFDTNFNAEPSGKFDGGLLTWTSGDNVDKQFEVKAHTIEEGICKIELQIPTDLAISVGDDYSIAPGCDKIKDSDCSAYSNVANFGGEPFCPGDDKLIYPQG